MKYFFSLILVISGLLLNAQEWSLLTPIKTGDILRNCSFFDSQNGYCVIQVDGTVLKTTDGGLTWSRPWTPGISTNLYDIEMITMDTIFTSGVQGEIFRSIDSGNSWIEMTTPTNEYLYALEFVNSSLGFATGFNGVILKTTDGGDSWELKESGTTSRLYDIEFVNDLTGFACGWNGTVLKTTDGGETWESLDTGYGGALFNCSFPSETVGYACGWSQTILKTDDGGNTWEEQNSGSNTLNYIEFKDEQIGYAAGDWGNYYKTTNGGSTWISSGATGGAAIWSGQYIDENNAFLMGTGIMLKSTDDVASWDMIKNGVPNAKYNGVFFHSDTHGTAVGSVGITGEGSNASGIIETTDGGQTWDIQQQGFSNGWWDVHYADLNNGTAIGGVNFAKTTDGGDTWIYSTLPMTLTGVSTWWFDSQNGFVGGDGLFSDICKTDNGGSSYLCGDNLGAGDFFFLDELTGYAIRDAGTENIRKTTDGGETWDYIPTGNFAGKLSVFFLDENIGWIGAKNGAVLRTIDGGDTWEFSNYGYDIIGIHFYDENTGFCVDNQSYVYFSEDGGASWTTFLSGDDFTMPVAKEGYFTDNFLYLGSQGGDIYKCELGCGDISAGTIVADTDWCEGQSDLIYINQTTPIVSWEWTLPEGWTTEDNDGLIEVIAGTNGGVIEVTVTSACGSTASAEHSVNVTPQVQEISGIENMDLICSGVSFVASIANSQEGVDYNWQLSSGWSGSSNSEQIEITPGTGDGWLSVFAENDCGTSEDYFVNLTLLESTDATFDLPFSESCPNTIIELTSGNPEGGSYSGPGIDGDFLDLNGMEPGEIEITYFFTNENGCESAASDLLTIISDDISGGSLIGETEICQGDNLDFTLIQVEGADEYTWVFPDSWEATVSDNQLSVLSASESGTVQVTASNNCGNSEIFDLEIEVLELPATPILTTFSDNWCENSSGYFEIESLEGEDELVWLNDMSWDINNLGDLAIEVTAPTGNYELSFYTYNYCGVSDTITLNIEVFEIPDVSLSFDYDILCTEEIYNATVSPAGGVLTGPGVNELTIESFFLNPDEPYNYLYTAESEFGCINSAGITLTFETCVGIDEMGNSVLMIYPNPVSYMLYIQSDFSIGKIATVYDFKGKIVISQVIKNPLTTIDISDLNNGEYVIQIGDVVSQFQVIK